MVPTTLMKSLADPTRLTCVLLVLREQELCVCELTEATQLSQPKISRHLAQLREGGILADRRQGQWIFYRLNSSLPGWANAIIHAASDGHETALKPALARLSAMGQRPSRQAGCC